MGKTSLSTICRTTRTRDGDLGDFEQFVSSLVKNPLSELELAVAILWYEDIQSSGAQRSANEIAKALEETRLTGKINVSRLKRRLAASPFTVRGTSDGTFRIALKLKPRLDESYLSLLKNRYIEFGDEILPQAQVIGTRPYIERLAHQVNGTYRYGMYDACAVMCRRLVESLLIEAFVNSGAQAAIERKGVFVGLDEVLATARSGQHVKLPRGCVNLLEKVKEIGDTAAHDRFHLTGKQDIDEIRFGFRKSISQLLGIAAISAGR